MAAILVFTGAAGSGILSAAAATALHAASQQRVLLLSVGAPGALGALLGAPAGSAPAEVAPGLDALAIDGLAEAAAAWERSRSRMPTGAAAVAGDELPIVPGAEMAFALARLRELAPRYDLVVADAGPHDMLLRALALPDALRWGVRLLFGLDRGPGKSNDSIGRALLPTSLIPIDAYSGIQDARVGIESLRDMLLEPGAAAVRYVLRPDAPAFAEAQLAVPALQLHGLAVQAIVAGPLLPASLAGTPLGGALAAQDRLLESARSAWPSRSFQRFELADGTGLGALRAQGAQLAATPPGPAAAPIATVWQGAPALAIALPGLPKGALQLTLSGDELIVRVGPYRRHLLLPDSLRGVANIRATREGEHLVVRRR